MNIPGRRRRLAVDAQIALAAAFDDGVTHIDRDALRLSAARFPDLRRARPAAATLTCAAAATRNDDGNCGSSPVSVTSASAARSPPPRSRDRREFREAFAWLGILGGCRTRYHCVIIRESGFVVIARSEATKQSIAAPWIASLTLAMTVSSLMKIPRARQDAYVAGWRIFWAGLSGCWRGSSCSRFDQRGTGCPAGLRLSASSAR